MPSLKILETRVLLGILGPATRISLTALSSYITTQHVLRTAPLFHPPLLWMLFAGCSPASRCSAHPQVCTGPLVNKPLSVLRLITDVLSTAVIVTRLSHGPFLLRSLLL